MPLLARTVQTECKQLAFCRGAARSRTLLRAKVQISEHNTKQKSIFFVFIVERKYLRGSPQRYE